MCGSCQSLCRLRFLPHNTEGLAKDYLDNQRDDHNKPDNRFRYDDTHIIQTRDEQHDNQHFADQFDAAGHQRRDHVAHALERIAQDRNHNGDKIENAVDMQIFCRGIENFCSCATGYHVDQRWHNGVAYDDDNAAPDP